MKIIFSILFILSSMIGGNLTKPMESIEMENSVLYVEDNVNTYDLSSGVNEFTGSATPLALNTTATGYFYHAAAKLLFSFNSTKRQYIKLNYTGLNSKLHVYNSYYYSTSDYLQYIPDIRHDEDIIYMDKGQTYILEFTNISSYGNMSITPQRIDHNFLDHEKYILKITYDENSTLGHHYDVEYFDVSLTEATSTNGNINLNFNGTEYLDLIDENVHFNITNDSRRMVSEPGYSYYSAIAYAQNSVSFLYNDTIVNDGFRSTATFLDETTVLSCAHSVYKDMYVKDQEGVMTLDKTSLIKSFKFLPGINSYPNVTNYLSKFGEYKAYVTYVPMSYALYEFPYAYDWAISLTNNTIIGEYNHSFMGLQNFDSIGTISNPSSFAVQFVGYPDITKEKDENNEYINQNNFTYTMWTSYPLLNSVYGLDNYLLSNTIISSGGNSGGPWFMMNSNTVNGVSYYYIGIIGVHHGKLISGEPVSCRIRPIIINIYKELINYEA